MSLFLEERMKEQIEDPDNDKIIFTYPWIDSFAPRIYSRREVAIQDPLRTSYHLGTEKWSLHLSENGIIIYLSDFRPIREWKGSSCFVSYNLYYDDDMRFLLYSSPRIKMEKASDSFQTPDGFTTKIIEAFNEKKLSDVVINIELHLPLKWFYRPFDNPMRPFSKKACDEYPADLENDYKFVFLKTSDYSIKCSDGTVSASKMVLNISSTFMIKHFKKSNENELIVDFSVDVVKPVIYYLHSRCFEMPASYDLDYARRLLKVIDHFEPEQETLIRKAVHQSLCRKFVEKKTYTFDSLLPWISFVSKHSFYALTDMITSLIADKYYFKWHEVFPENARNDENANFREVFGSHEDFEDGNGSLIFDEIERIIMDTFQCNVILP